MPTESKKEKSKIVKSTIKVEPEDLHPLSYYVDDRVELIRQIFLSLKSKTIKSIAPDFLQGKTLEDIQELCLDELLGISKKRLNSIINATQCPANTDSSDSEVENIEEHISLEEISSDSADETSLNAKQISKDCIEGGNSAKNGVNSKSTEPESGKKEVSVLELLELQARARAIRSQLALEPITKIELDSDNEAENSNPSTGQNSFSQIQANQPKSIPIVKENNGIQVIRPDVAKVKPVRLKRNFRQRQNSDYDPDDSDDNTKPANSDEQKDKVSTTDNIHETSSSNVNTTDDKKDEEKERSPSPDIIPIVLEPETYCISSDSDEGSSSVPKYINFPVVAKENLPETEDEKFLRKIKEGTGSDLRNLIKARREVKDGNGQSGETEKSPTIGTVSSTQNAANSSLTSSNDEMITETNFEQSQSVQDTESEEGELTDDDDDKNSKGDDVTILSSDDEKDAGYEKQENETDNRKDEDDHSDSSSESNDSSSSDCDVKSINKELSVDDDEDIIDLGKDEELDLEMKEVECATERNVKKVKKAKKKKSEIQDSVVDVHKFDAENDAVACNERKVTSEDGNQLEGDTWEARWLRGKNVTKVMATSRLANKVRTKIKQKKSKVENDNENTLIDVAVDPVPVSTAEEGSVQHYEELVAQDTDSKIE